MDLTSPRCWWRRAAVFGIVLYVIGITVLLLRQGTWPTPDFLIPPLVLIALLMGRGWSFVIDWLPFLLLILVYEGFRGIADDLNSRVHIQELIDTDRWLTGGFVPTIELQARFFDPARIAWYDWVAALLHAAHFAAPVIMGFLIWRRSRLLYWRYAVTVLGLFFAGFFTAWLYPAAPPWLASDWGYLPQVHRVLDPTLAQLRTGDGLTFAYQEISPNAVAAMPSLHAATPMLLALIVMSLAERRAWPVLLYPLAGGIAWVYLGEHYLIDVIAGWVYAGTAFVILWELAPLAVAYLVTRLDGVRITPPGLRPLPAWPLATVAVLFIAYVWFGPIVRARLDSPASLPEGERFASAAASTVGDLGLVDCGSGASTTPVPDDLLSSVTGRYAGFIQGVESGSCYVFTSERAYEPLTMREMRRLQRTLSPGAADVISRDDGWTYVKLGQPSPDLIEVGDASFEDLYFVVLQVDTGDNQEALQDVLRQVASLVLND